MKQKTNNKILCISLIISIAGIILLIILSQIEPSSISISEIQNKSLGERIKLQGNLTNTRELAKNFYSAILQDKTGSIMIVLNKNLSIQDNLEILGKIQEYKNQTQIQAEKIIELK